MASLHKDAVLAFFDDFQTAQLTVWNAALDPSLKWIQLVRKKKALKAFLEADPKTIVEMLHRPRAADDAWYEQHGARKVGKRTVFAVQPVSIGESAVALYTSDFFDPAGLTDRFLVAEVDGSLCIVARHALVAGSWTSAGGRNVRPTAAGDASILTEGPDEKSRKLLSALT